MGIENINNISFNSPNFKIDEWALNEEGARVLRIIKALEHNYQKYGAAYCPGKVERINENICPCFDYTTTGICKCGLYKPVTD